MRAMTALAQGEPDKFKRLLNKARKELGLPPVGDKPGPRPKATSR